MKENELSKNFIHCAEGGRIAISALIDVTHRVEEAPKVYDRLIQEPAFPLVQFDWRKE